MHRPGTSGVPLAGALVILLLPLAAPAAESKNAPAPAAPAAGMVPPTHQDPPRAKPPGAARAARAVELRSPGFPPSSVAPDGSLVEPWGNVRVDLVEPPGASALELRPETRFAPAAVAVSVAGPIRVERTAYRAPIWPGGVDVLEVAVTNTGERPARAKIRLVAPGKMEIGQTMGVIEGKPSLALAPDLADKRERRPWGCATAATPLPKWGKPAGPCHPAFRSIRAGMGGIPIRYEISVEPGSARTIALGFCESHHTDAGARVMTASVEGAASQTLDPIARWGRHAPGALVYAARDADRDGRIAIEIAPHPDASDHNPILNGIWIFDAGRGIAEKDLVAGKLDPVARQKIDVGGEGDQSLYPPGEVVYAVELAPRQKRDLLVLARSPGAPGVPDPETMKWTAASLRRAAADVWRDRWAEPAGQ